MKIPAQYSAEINIRTAEREASAQRARAEALEEQLKRLGNALPSTLPIAWRGTRTKKRSGDPLLELRKQFEAMLAKMQTPEARAAGDALVAATGKEIGRAAIAQAATDRKPKRKSTGRNPDNSPRRLVHGT